MKARIGIPKAALHAGERAHYEDARLYDHIYARRRKDVLFYARTAERIGGPVLEFGVGTGRVAVAIARRGAEITGIEKMPSMLVEARARLRREPPAVQARVTLRRGDFRSARLGRKFRLVIAPFSVFMHMVDRRELERALAAVKRHLARGGRLLFDVLMPDPRMLSRNPARTYKCRTVSVPGTRAKYRYGEIFEYDDVSQVQLVSMLYERETNPDDYFLVPLVQRQWYPQELEAMLHYNGFEVVRMDGDFEGGPLSRDSESMVVQARLRRC